MVIKNMSWRWWSSDSNILRGQRKRKGIMWSNIMIWLNSVSSLLVVKLGLFLLLFTCAVECQYESEITWTISKTSSCEDEQQLGCRCQISQLKPNPLTKITCSCNNEQTQVVNLYGSRNRGRVIANHDMVWRIENCHNVTVHNNVLPFSSAGAEFKFELDNISALTIREDAFKNIGSTSTPHLDKSVKISNCKIKNIPPRAFPSSLKKIEFVNCEIGKIESKSFKQLVMNEMIFENTTIDDIQPESFDQALNYFYAKNSRFKRIQTNSITGGIRNMNWSTCVIDYMQGSCINALIGHSLFQESQFRLIEPNGLTIKEWTSFSLINNIFHRVNDSGIDLTQRSSDTATLALIKGNIWHQPSPNFIITGQVETAIAAVENNTFTEICECGKSFAHMVTMKGSKQWFVKELLQNSKCPITAKATACLDRNDTFLFFDELDLLCEVYACTKDLQAVSEIFTPQLPDRLRILAIFIGTLAGAILVSLLVTMCVFVLRRRHDMTKRNNETSDITKSLGQDYSDVVYKMPQSSSGPSLRPRSTLFCEDVEMEDKGVQTMPSELSTDVLEGLREKLSRPDSFWDAKETIDHLYGLIQVREQSSNHALSSPPDVTMCNTTINNTGSHHNATTTTNKSANSLPSSHPPNINSSATSTNNNALNAASNRYAQIRPKPKTATTLCEYRDPSDSQVHIYSELSSHHSQRQPQQQQQQQRPTLAHNVKGPSLPILCEYTEPKDKDVQAHVYAELAISQQMSQQQQPPPPSSTNIKTEQHNELFPPQSQQQRNNSTTNLLQSTSNTLASHTTKRPLPAIPSSFSSVQ